jgi:hypothetical protein
VIGPALGKCNAALRVQNDSAAGGALANNKDALARLSPILARFPYLPVSLVAALFPVLAGCAIYRFLPKVGIASSLLH